MVFPVPRAGAQPDQVFAGAANDLFRDRAPFAFLGL